ncbi:FAD/NAD(P)-binding domain-containing protein [Punctularia strigosozonata HHB-11173 SS5]|uniref:FAD/NAD(P)-binding domain-containing protein n=1 Tax=Punctularia strigosozonata (strain HHB-11173) TaxID=741275 RepID=UPI00044162CF|nr:FAD/NAD(P)-binding domain-containing protein [Punctularia strigosozonata HHB-11173 SS5]EIN09189.1 FAD/NAD(P)-binding domain-containing protein [Punctularia strigosozonata HHB-11173 SS5]
MPRTALPQTKPNKVVVIGGGATGLAALRSLVQAEPGSEKGPFDEVLLFERRKDVGGVWYLDPGVADIEQSLPAGHSDGVWPIRSPSTDALYWPSPAYTNLRGNVLPRFLTYSGHPFPPLAEGETFPSLLETHEYLASFAKPLRPHIRCNIEVQGVWELPPTETNKPGGWRVNYRDWNRGGEVVESHWDAVVVATGWYDWPVYPPVPGIKEAAKAGRVHHTRWYRGPAPYAHKRVVVVGNGNSANEAAAHIAAQRVLGQDEPVYRSIRTAQSHMFVSLPDERIKDVPVIKRYEMPTADRLDLVLDDDSVIENVDYVLLGTGYHIGRIPWVHVLQNDGAGPSHEPISPAPPPIGEPVPPLSEEDWPPRIKGLWAHSILARNPTLAFIGLPVSFTPFPLADLMGWLVRSVWDGSYSIPEGLEARLAEERERIELIKNRRDQLPSVQAAQRERWLKARDAGDPEALKKAAPDAAPIAAAYHLLAQNGDEIEHAKVTRRRVISAKPWLDQQLTRWDDEERERARAGMYQLRLRLMLEKAAKEKQQV